MIIGGAFRGLSRAVRQSLSFIWIYSLAGVPILLGLGLFLGGIHRPEMVGFLAVVHLLAIAAILPAAVVGNFLALRALGWRSWRYEPWRARVAGGVAVPMVWVGALICTWRSFDIVPEPLRVILGEWAMPVFLLAMVITFSNVSLLVAWLLPPRKRARTREER